jgi:hypothetical protein
MNLPNTKSNRRSFLRRSAAASAGVYSMSAGLSLAQGTTPAPQATPVAPNSKGTVPAGKIGKWTISRLISGGNLLSGWCHQRDLLYVRNLAGAYLTEQKQFDTLQMLEELGVNAIVLDPNQQHILKKYKQVRGGKMQTIVCVREDWGDWSTGHWDGLRIEILKSIENGSDLVYLHGGYSDRLVQANKPENIEVIAKAMQFMREQGFSAGLGAHELQVLKTCDNRGIQPDFYVKTFHHDRYWSATPRERRKPYTVDGPRSLDHNEFHDNIFCLDAEGTAEFMLEKSVPWIAFKVLAAGAIAPESGFKYAFENGADFVAVGMFDFEVKEDVRILLKTLANLQRGERPWAQAT